MSKLVLVALAPVALGFLVWLFARWERQGKEHFVVFLLIGMLVIETSLYENQDNMPRDIFHPGSGSLEFRLPEVIILAALLARLVVRGRPRRIGIPALLWLAVGAWLTVAAVEGVLRHNDATQLRYEAKAIIYVVGGFALAAGVPVRRYLEGKGLTRLVQWSGVSALILELLSLHHKMYAVNLPLLPLPDFGVLGPDTATIFVTLGVIGLLLELARERRNRVTMLAVIPLLLSPFESGQRAALIDLGVALGVVVVVAFGGTARRRLGLTSGQVALSALVIAGGVLGLAVVPALVSQHPVSVPLSSKLTETFGSEGKLESAQERSNQWQVAWGDIEQHPLIGEGMGFEYNYYAPGPNQYVLTDLTHNIALDLLLRSGVIGLGLFVAALGVSLVEGFAAWRLHPDRIVAVLALALVAVIAGIVAKGMVESIFEKYRVATMLGLMLGMLRSAVTSGGDLRTALGLSRPHEQVV